MRHESVETTMTYYVGVNAEATADELWNALGKLSGKQAENPKHAESKNP